MKEPEPPTSGFADRASVAAACVAALVEVEIDEIPPTGPGEDLATSPALKRWLAGRGLGIVPIREPVEFSWAGPWIAAIEASGWEETRAVVMFGVPAGVAWDPAGITGSEEWHISAGHAIANLDVAPQQPAAARVSGVVEAICISAAAGGSIEHPAETEAVAGRGLVGDRHHDGHGTFPSGVTGSAITLIEAEVCETFEPPLEASEHRRNLITRGVSLNDLVGRDFMAGPVHCRGARLCEPCSQMQRYSGRPVLRPLVHRGGLRADVIGGGVISIGDPISSRDGAG